MKNKFFVEVNDNEISGFWPRGDKIRICYDANLNGDRVEFGYIKKKLFCRKRFIMTDYVPANLLTSIKLVVNQQGG